MNSIKINIVGAGAIGHLWASFLQKNTVDVNLYARHHRPPCQFHVQSPLAKFDSLIQYHEIDQWREPDLIFICVKAHHLEALCQSLQRKVTNSCPIVLMMNGMGLVEICGHYLPENPTIHASLVHGAYLDNDRLVHTGNGKTILGNLDTQLKPEDFAQLIVFLDTLLPKIEWSDEHETNMKLKVIINAIINPITALLDIDNGELLYQGQLIPPAEVLLKELTPFLKHFLPDLSPEEIRQQIITVALNTAHNRSSMRQDVLKGQATEIDFINGYLIQQAEKQSIVLNEHHKIVNQIKALPIN